MYSKLSLYKTGLNLIKEFCEANTITVPDVVLQHTTGFSACAYYRPTYIVIGLSQCASCCSDTQVRNWNWPGSVTDRTPYGVLAHELGHHCDVISSVDQSEHKYIGTYSKTVYEGSGEKPITSYCPNYGEWFAEMFRLFVTNPNLLKQIRPKTYKLIRAKFLPIKELPWRERLGSKVPSKIIRTLKNKGAK